MKRAVNSNPVKNRVLESCSNIFFTLVSQNTYLVKSGMGCFDAPHLESSGRLKVLLLCLPY